MPTSYTSPAAAAAINRVYNPGGSRIIPTPKLKTPAPAVKAPVVTSSRGVSTPRQGATGSQPAGFRFWMGPTDAQKYAAQHGNGLVPGAQISVPSGLGSGFSNFNFPQKTITPVPAGKTWTPYIDTSNVNPQGPLLSKPSVPNMPVPIGGAPAVDTSAIAPAAPAGPDWMALLKMLQGPAGPNYGALLAGLGTPGKIADLNTPDLHYIYNDFSQPISKAWENLASQIQGFGTAAVGREQAAQDALAQGFGQTRK